MLLRLWLMAAWPWRVLCVARLDRSPARIGIDRRQRRLVASAASTTIGLTTAIRLATAPILRIGVRVALVVLASALAT